jgi:hypothetical protein
MTMLVSNSLAFKMAAVACEDKREFLRHGLDFLIHDESSSSAPERAAGV